MRHLLPCLLLLAACGVRDEDDAVLCADRADNDKDGLVDCMEPACAAFCVTDTASPPTAGHTGQPPLTPTDDTAPPVTTDTAPELVRLGGTVVLDNSWNPEGFRVELLGSGLPPVYTDPNGDWEVDVPPGTYPWRLTAPDDLPVPSTGTELTVRTPAPTPDDTGTSPYDQTFDVQLPTFVADGTLPLFQAQLTTGLIVTVEELTPPVGQDESETFGAIVADVAVPIEGVQQVHRMFHLRPYGHLGTIDVDLIYPFDPDYELWTVDPATGRWRSYGGFTDLGGGQIRASRSVPFVTTLAVVTP